MMEFQFFIVCSFSYSLPRKGCQKGQNNFLFIYTCSESNIIKDLRRRISKIKPQRCRSCRYNNEKNLSSEKIKEKFSPGNNVSIYNKINMICYFVLFHASVVTTSLSLSLNQIILTQNYSAVIYFSHCLTAFSLRNNCLQKVIHPMCGHGG